ncbi:MAG TPA: hypothetical protein VLM37_10900 [Fibrobacteraceae bacterium]|nr:hypothetical protein [Fibrobacteraceae bacterium]
MKTVNTLIVLAGLASVSFASTELAEDIDNKVHSIEVRRGLDFGISIKSEYLTSRYSSPQIDDFSALAASDSAFDKNYGSAVTSNSVERTGYTQLDLNVLARPFDIARVDFTLRFLAGYQDYFNNPTKSVSMPWCQINGRLGKEGNMAIYEFGDYRSQISPLTMWAPGIDILYEPTVFARKKEMARSEFFLKGNQRNLQGGQIQYRLGLGAFDLRLEAMGARLRRAEQLDSDGYTGNLVANSSLAGASQSANMDKYMMGGNAEGFALGQAIMVGGSYFHIADIKSSMVRVLKSTTGDVNDSSGYTNADYTVWNEEDTLPQQTDVMGARLGADIAHFIGDKNLLLDFTAEYASSGDKEYNVDSSGVILDDSIVNGAALLAEMNAGYSGKSWVAKANFQFMNNDENYFNNLAQSPQFVPRRILNTDMDPHTMRWGSRSPLYSTFDALYNFTPKFTPNPVKVSTEGKYTTNTATDPTTTDMNSSLSYEIAPFTRSSWGTAVLTKSELKLVQELGDPTLQDALPFGLATANRTGFRTRWNAGFLKDSAGVSAVEATVVFGSLEEVEDTTGYGKAKFSEVGGGAKVDLGAILKLGLPVEFSGSYTQTKTEQGVRKNKSDFINVGFYGRFHKRYGVFAGLQTIDLKRENNAEVVSLTNSKQKHWQIGLDYSVGDHAWLSVGYGLIDVDNTYAVSYGSYANKYVVSYTTDADGNVTVVETYNPSADAISIVDDYAESNGYLLPDYYTSGDDDLSTNAKTYKHSFQQKILEASINVDF